MFACASNGSKKCRRKHHIPNGKFYHQCTCFDCKIFYFFFFVWEVLSLSLSVHIYQKVLNFLWIFIFQSPTNSWLWVYIGISIQIRPRYILFMASATHRSITNINNIKCFSDQDVSHLRDFCNKQWLSWSFIFGCFNIISPHLEQIFVERGCPVIIPCGEGEHLWELSSCPPWSMLTVNIFRE